MMLPAIGLVVGIIIALLTPLRFPIEYSQYIAIGDSGSAGLRIRRYSSRVAGNV